MNARQMFETTVLLLSLSTVLHGCRIEKLEKEVKHLKQEVLHESR